MKWLLFFALLMCLPAAVAGELLSETNIGGHLKSSLLYLDRIPGLSDDGRLASERFRLDLNSRLAEHYELEISLEQQLIWSDPSSLVALPQDSFNRIIDDEQSWNRNGRFEMQLHFDRFVLGGEHAGLRWTLGRQAIGFGRISLFSPLDVIAPFPPDAIDVDVRPGVDAIRLQHYFGFAGQVGGILVFGDRPRHNSYLLTLGENYYNLDLLFLAGSLRGRPMAGVGLAGELGPLGLKAEVSCYRGTEVGKPAGDLRDAFAIAALEGWYRFDNGLVLLGQYLYNGPGSNNPKKYRLVASSAPLQEGLSFLLARHYLLLGPSYELHPLVTANGLLIQNLQDSSSLMRPQLAISLANNLQLDLFWAFAFGKKPQPDSVTDFPVVRSEFGSAGDSGGLLLRWYF